ERKGTVELARDFRNWSEQALGVGSLKGEGEEVSARVVQVDASASTQRPARNRSSEIGQFQLPISEREQADQFLRDDLISPAQPREDHATGASRQIIFELECGIETAPQWGQRTPAQHRSESGQVDALHFQ